MFDTAAEHCDLIVRSEILIDAPPATVWAPFLDMGAWMSGLHFATVSGRRGEEGEVRLVSPVGQTPYGAYFVKTVRATAARQFVMRVTPKTGTDYFGFADFSFYARGERTMLVYNIYVELNMSGRTDEKSRAAFCADQDKVTRTEVNGNNQNLKILVEKKSPRLDRQK